MLKYLKSSSKSDIINRTEFTKFRLGKAWANFVSFLIVSDVIICNAILYSLIFEKQVTVCIGSESPAIRFTSLRSVSATVGFS